MEDKNRNTRGDKPEDPEKTPVQRLYDKIPLTYKQVDIIVKVLMALLVVLLVLGFIKGNG